MTGPTVSGGPAGGHGLQPERTYLAWQRTGLSFAGVGALLVHAAGGLGVTWRLLPGLLGLATGGLVVLRAQLRYRRAGDPAGTSPGARVLLVAALTGALGVGALLLLLGTT